VNSQVAAAGRSLAIHTLALIVGLAMVTTGLGLGVTMIGLPLGLPIGLVGVLLCLWGLFGTLPPRRAENPRIYCVRASS
jgi:hypothetical protein